MPLIIKNAGSEFTVNAEIGQPRIVYANGVRIGILDDYPYSTYSRSVGVRLDEYPDQKIYLSKNGQYTGLNSVTNETLYYKDTECTGTPYVLVIRDYNRNWWLNNVAKNNHINNNGQHYSLSDEVYKMDNGYRSYLHDDTTLCQATTVSNSTNGYKLATATNTPDLPVFSPPITIDGILSYDSLPEAN